MIGVGGDGVYEYSLDGAAFQSINVYPGLSVGTYNVTIRDSNGCTSICVSTIIEPSVLSCTAVGTTVSDCGVNDGTIIVTATGGTSNYTYDAGAGSVISNVINDLLPGTYEVTVTDANGCTSLCSAEIGGLNIPCLLYTSPSPRDS